MNIVKYWKKKQRLAAPSRFYGDGGTWHGTPFLHVEVHDGKVVSVWFRCQQLPFQQVNVDEARSEEMDSMTLPKITGVEVLDA